MKDLTLAVPSKGRLMEATRGWLGEAGVQLVRQGNERNYLGEMKGFGGVGVLFQSASEIASGLVSGKLDLGVTGKDLLWETSANPTADICVLETLGFGFANVVVAVPKSWIDVDTMVDLKEVSRDLRQKKRRTLRVATKYLEITRRFFSQHGIADYRIVESLGATEGAPAAGTADIIVDITTSGATLEANNLKVVDDGTILESEACLAASLNARWSAKKLSAALDLFEPIVARAQARGLLEVRCQGSEELAKAREVLEDRFGCGYAFEYSVEGGDNVFRIRREDLGQFVREVRKVTTVVLSVSSPDYLFGESNAMYETLVESVGKGVGA